MPESTAVAAVNPVVDTPAREQAASPVSQVSNKNDSLGKAYGVASAGATRSRKTTDGVHFPPVIATGSADTPSQYAVISAQHPNITTTPSGKPRSHTAPNNTVSLPPAALADLERMKYALSEKDREMFRLKQELGFLKRAERRQQRELEEMHELEEDAPRIILLLRDELQAVKLKLKQVNASHTSDERLLRQYTEKINHLTERNGKYKKLLKERDLEARELLAHELDAEKEKLSTLEKSISEMQRKADLNIKNLNSENRSLRVKLGASEKENEQLKQKLADTETSLKEKEKNLSSLEMYRYKIVHGMTEADCRVCKKREQEKNERQRRQEITAKIPQLNAPRLNMVSSTSLDLTVDLPPRLDPINYNTVKIFQYENPIDLQASQNAKEYVVTVQEGQQVATIPLDGLVTGQRYYFVAQCWMDTFFGAKSKPVEGVADLLPGQPATPQVHLDTHTLTLSLSKFSWPAENGGSPCTILNIYQITSPTALSPDTDLAEAAQKIGIVRSPEETFSIFNPHPLGCFYYFLVSATNAIGEGGLSAVTEGLYVDVVPSKPKRPRVKKLPKNTVMVNVGAVECVGSSVTSYEIHWTKEPTEVETPARPHRALGRRSTEPFNTAGSNSLNTSGVGPKEWDPKNRMEVDASEQAFTINDLDGGNQYRFRIVAKNACGRSPHSEWSDMLVLDSIIATPTAPGVEVISGTSARVLLPDAHSFCQASMLRKLAGYHIFASFDANMTDAISVGTVTVSSVTPRRMKSRMAPRTGNTPQNSEHSLNVNNGNSAGSKEYASYLISDLERGGNYYFAIQAFGATSGIESKLSPSVWVPLATSIALPVSTSSLDNIRPQSQQTGPNGNGGAGGLGKSGTPGTEEESSGSGKKPGTRGTGRTNASASGSQQSGERKKSGSHALADAGRIASAKSKRSSGK